MAPSVPAQSGRPRVLIVEDDDAVRRSLQLLLVACGYDVRAYRCGAGLRSDPEAMEAACLIADLIIPQGDGLGLIQDLRAGGFAGRAILISGHLTDEWASLARKLGFDAVLPKPIGETILINWVSRLLDKGQPNGPVRSDPV